MHDIKIPGPDHPLKIVRNGRRLQALFHGHLIADSGRAMTLVEADFPPTHYFPREDVEMAVFSRTDHTTHCPYKGTAHYWTLHRDGEVVDNALKSYENPHPAAEALRGLVAFQRHLVTFVEVEEEREDEDRAMSDYIRHTDSGSGLSQDTPWPATVGRAGEETPRT